VRSAAFLALALLVVAANASPRIQARAPAGRTERTVPFRIGETLTYDVSWSTFLVAGTVVTTVKEKKQSFDSTAYYMVAEARPTPLLSSIYALYYKLDTLLDASTLLSQRGSLYTEEGKRHSLKTTLFDRKAKRAFFEYQSATTVKADFPIAASTQDALSAIYVLRTIPLNAGAHLTMPVSDDGVKYTMTIDVVGQERVKTPVGESSAWKVVPVVADEKGDAAGRNMAIWISNDARRYPLKMQAELPLGTFVLSLRDAGK
jgi:Protein of unknown function (DUF3108)